MPGPVFKRWVFINLDTFTIEDIQVFTITPPAAPNGYRWISQDNFALPDVIPQAGMIWNQDPLKAVFTDRAPTSEFQSQTEALAAAKAKLQEGLDLIAIAESLG